MKGNYNIPDALTTLGVVAGTAISYKVMSELGITSFYANEIPHQLQYGDMNHATGMVIMGTVSLLPVMAASALTIKATVSAFKQLGNFAKNLVNSDFGKFFRNLNDGIIRFTEGKLDNENISLQISKDGVVSEPPKVKHGLYQTVTEKNGIVENTYSNYNDGKLTDTSERIAMLRQKIDTIRQTQEETYISMNKGRDLENSQVGLAR